MSINDKVHADLIGDKIIGKVNFQNPIKLDVTADEFGNSVQWNSEKWLLTVSQEAEDFRNECLKDFNKRFGNK